MTLLPNDKRIRQFVTTIGLITSDGPYGPNVMAVEWTHHVSYSPSLITVSIRATDATAENIRETGEFGVNLAGEGQNIVCSVAGGATAREVDKVAVLRELGVRFYPASRIKALMIEGSAMNAECKLVKTIELGDHITFVGEVVEISVHENTRPLLYHMGKYWTLGYQVMKPPEEERHRIMALMEAHAKTLQAV